MEQLTEFVSNNLFLFAGLLVVLVLLIKAEYEHQTNKAEQLTPAQATRLMNGDEETLILDIRSSDEFSKGHVKKAMNVPLPELANSLDKLKKYEDKPVLVYCNNGISSMKAGRILQKSGFTKINNLASGISGWKEASLPVTKK